MTVYLALFLPDPLCFAFNAFPSLKKLFYRRLVEPGGAFQFKEVVDIHLNQACITLPLAMPVPAPLPDTGVACTLESIRWQYRPRTQPAPKCNAEETQK